MTGFSVVSMGGSVGRGEASGVTGAAGKTGRADAKLHRHVHHEPVHLLKLGFRQPFQAADGAVIQCLLEVRPRQLRICEPSIPLDPIQLHSWVLQVLVRALERGYGTSGSVVAFVQFAGLLQSQGFHEPCPAVLGDQRHGCFVDDDAPRQSGIATGVVEDVIIALAQLGHHEVHQVHMPAGGESHDEPLQHRLSGGRNFLKVAAAVGVESHGQHGLEGCRHAVKVPHLGRLRSTRLR
mmetsp:Transcript_29750/g.70138  ORF Transcript_29750/g.70138 Transcript_29750/m.70138 type:complete len:237 (-) Transcript_29750:2543-3253(-)